MLNTDDSSCINYNTFNKFNHISKPSMNRATNEKLEQTGKMR